MKTVRFTVLDKETKDKKVYEYERHERPSTMANTQYATALLMVYVDCNNIKENPDEIEMLIWAKANITNRKLMAAIFNVVYEPLGDSPPASVLAEEYEIQNSDEFTKAISFFYSCLWNPHKHKEGSSLTNNSNQPQQQKRKRKRRRNYHDTSHK